MGLYWVYNESHLEDHRLPTRVVLQSCYNTVIIRNRNLTTKIPRNVELLLIIFMIPIGLLDTSVTWVINSATQSLAFILADQG